MTDTHSPEARSRNMAAVKGKNTKPEIQIRSLLHKAGYRFRLHDKNIIGKPDIILKKYNAVIFVHGCFWHSHGCYKSTIPKTNESFWREKLSKNKLRDQNVVCQLIDNGWRVLIVWECAIAGKNKLSEECLIKNISEFLRSDKTYIDIP